MKVLQINSVCGFGSTGRIVVGISKKLEQNNYENYVFYGVGKSDHKNSIKFGGTLNVRKHQIVTRLLDKHGFSSKSATNKMIDKIKQINPDVIHLHNLHGHYLNVEILFNYLKEYNKKVIWTLHDCWSFTGHCAYYDFANCNKWQTHCENCPEKKSYPVSFFIDNSYNNYEKKKALFTGLKNLTIVTPSEWLAKEVKKSFLKEYPVKVINNGIDLTIFKPIESNFREKKDLNGKFLILGVALGWSRRKGINYFFELSKKLKNDEKILLVGLSDKQLKKLPKSIIGIKRTNSIKELVEIYSSSDVFVNPTLEDNFPTTNLEALACGTPVITFDTGGSPESIDKNTGFVVEKGNMEELYKAVKLIRENSVLNYSQACIKRATRFYDKDDAYEKYIKIYEEVIKSND